jgi:hypothetical protein
MAELEKAKRYRARKAAQGQCPHCGKPSFPYYECEERRRYKRTHIILRKLIKRGVLERRPDGRYYPTAPEPPEVCSHRIQPDDRRYLPRPVGKLLRFLFPDVNGPMDLEGLASLAGSDEAVDRELADLLMIGNHEE